MKTSATTPPGGKPGGPATPSKKAPATPVLDRGFEVQLLCPHCGGPFVASDATVSHVCQHCRSLLIIGAPEREEIFVEPAQVSDPKAILETLLQYRLDAHRSALVAEHSDEEGNLPPELLIAPLLKRFETRLRETAKIVDCRPIHVPYRQTSGKIVQAVLGRRGEGAKVARLRAYTAEQTTQAYDAAQFNLRDTGLRLGHRVFRPLLSADVARLGRFLPRTEANESRRELEKWRGQNLEAGFESVAKQGQVVVSFEATVYRPYFLVRAILDRGDETLLFDGSFGTIAGYVKEDERDRFTRGKDTDPLGTQNAAFRSVNVVAARCPNCGADPKLAEDALVTVCENCHAGVAPSGSELRLVNYEREDGVIPARETTFLPFWRLPFEIRLAGAAPIKTLEAYAKIVFPQALPTGFAPQGESIYVPAWRLLTTQAGDEAYATLAQALHTKAWNWTSDRIGLDLRPKFVPASISESEAKELGWASLFAFHTKASAARLNTLLLKTLLFDAKVSFGTGTVAFLGFTSNQRVYARPDMSVSMLLVDGGPLLAAQRVSVQAAAAEFIASQKRPSISARIKTSRFSPTQE
ncbi:MAG: hypothetical protein ABI672_15935 [Vicinamibacteria bacterium]